MYSSALALLPLLALGPLASANPHVRRNNSSTSASYTPQPARANAVKQTFQIAWDGYIKYAFPNDALKPVTNSYSNDRNGWGASAVDALSTAIIMEKWDVVNKILEFVPTINFDNTTTDVSLFETTIRYLGGMLSGYDLLTGPFVGRVNDTSLVPKLLQQARHLADNLAVAFGTPSGVPDNDLLFGPPRRSGSTSNGIATIGTLVLEWTRLGDLLGEPAYGQLAQRGESYLLRPQPQAVAEPFPGLIGTNVNVSNGLFLDGAGGWVGGADSFYEYLLKMYLYDPARFGQYKDRWILAADSSIQYLASRPTTRPDLTFLAIYNHTVLDFVSEHLACFAGGNFILGGLTLNEPRYVQFGLDITSACYDTYASTATGIGPEIFRWQALSLSGSSNSSNINPAPPANQSSFYNSAGFWITDGVYVLRPEVLESIYYAYRATGDARYQDWAWRAFLAINSTAHVGSGYSDFNSVNTPGGGGFLDSQETFFFAEVLKYCYLIFAQDAPYQVKADHSNQFVFNTEAHPMRIASGYEKPEAAARRRGRR